MVGMRVNADVKEEHEDNGGGGDDGVENYNDGEVHGRIERRKKNRLEEVNEKDDIDDDNDNY